MNSNIIPFTRSRIASLLYVVLTLTYINLLPLATRSSPLCDDRWEDNEGGKGEYHQISSVSIKGEDSNSPASFKGLT